MRVHQKSLIALMLQKDSTLALQETQTLVRQLGPLELAELYVDCVFLETTMKFLQDQYWLQRQSKGKEISFPQFVRKFFDSELGPLLFFHETLEDSGVEDLEKFAQNAERARHEVVGSVAELQHPHNKVFAEAALKKMSELFEYEKQLQLDKLELGQQLGFSLYRAFDSLDEIFHLNYGLEIGVPSANSAERLYEGSGVGVQSSYVTLLMMLRALKLSKGSKFVDLGSGFGRVGFVIGLMRPDVQFLGYEFVPHRVKAANAICKSFGISDHVSFVTQDLAAKDFQIPSADVYYMYDPFNEETYQHVLKQLVAVGARQKMIVITKGNAKLRLQEADQKGNWSAPQDFVNGNFSLFRSNGA